MYQECPHGVVAGTCNWCMAEALDYQQRAIESIRQAVVERETREAIARMKNRPDHDSNKG